MLVTPSGGPLTEIPEHLLKRSKAAKAKATGEAAPAEAEAETSVTPAAASAAPAAPAANLPNLDPEPEPAKPKPDFVVASEARKRIPVWAMPVIVALPVWAYSFAGTMQQPPTEDVLFVDAEIEYGSCSGCHGAGGGGGNGYQLSDGEVLETFPEAIDQIVHVARGSAAIAGQDYGAERSDGERRLAGSRGVMPAQAESSNLLQIQLAVFHERVVLSGEETDTPEYEEWMEHLREEIEAGGLEDGDPIDLDFLLLCANEEYTPGATGAGSPDPEAQPCPGPGHGEEEDDAAEG